METNTRIKHPQHVPDEYMVNWTMKKLPHAKNFWITDLDMILRNRRGALMVIEIKRRNVDVPMSQKITLKIIDKLIRLGVKAAKGMISIGVYQLPIRYKGLHLLQFENTSFEDGKVFFDKKEVSEQQLIQILSMRD